jgi:ABC-type spermidine/putrescine transport system permease subunit II
MFISLRDGSTPVINAVSLVLMVSSAGIGLIGVFSGFEGKRP